MRYAYLNHRPLLVTKEGCANVSGSAGLYSFGFQIAVNDNKTLYLQGNAQ